MRTLYGLLAIAACVGSPATGEPGEEYDDLAVDHLHSDLPLYSFEWDDFWPRSFLPPDAIAGCSSRVAFGDWQFTPAPGNEFEGSEWYRFRNYGVFHCAAILSNAPERDELGDSRWEYGFFVKLGETTVDGTDWELWAIQEGTVPGSDYVLLARSSEGEGLVDRFEMLQQDCPRSAVREIRDFTFDIWRTRYCIIRNRTELLALARRMVRLPHRGSLQRVEDVGGQENSADAPE